MSKAKQEDLFLSVVFLTGVVTIIALVSTAIASKAYHSLDAKVDLVIEKLDGE